MKRLHTILTVLLALALIVSLVLRRNAQRDLQQELHTLRDANGTLRQALGDLTVSISQKDQQIDELQSSCQAQEKEPNSLHIPLPLAPKPPKPVTKVSIGGN
jgi:peptidoglycan hydrolase CwlO-like protein